MIQNIIDITFQILSFGLGALGIYYSIKQLFPSQLIFIEKDFVDLYNSKIKEINDLEIRYKNESIKDKAFLVRGFILNNGIKDLHKEAIVGKLKAVLKKGKWLDAKITNKPDDSDINLYVQENELVFDFPLLKSGEYFGFEALAETKDASIDFKQRIIDIKKVKNYKLSDLNSKSKQSFIYFLSSFFVFFVLSNYLYEDFFNSSYLFRTEYKTVVNHQFSMHFPTPRNGGDTTISITEPVHEYYSMDASFMDSLASEIHSKNAVINHLLLYPDTVYNFNDARFGKINVSYNQDAISEFKTMSVITILIFIMMVMFLIKSLKLTIYWYRFKKLV